MQGVKYESARMVVPLDDDALNDAVGTLTQHVANGVCLLAQRAVGESGNLHAWLVRPALLPGLIHVPGLTKPDPDYLASDGLGQSLRGPEAEAGLVQVG